MSEKKYVAMSEGFKCGDPVITSAGVEGRIQAIYEEDGNTWIIFKPAGSNETMTLRSSQIRHHFVLKTESITQSKAVSARDHRTRIQNRSHRFD